MIVLYSLIFLYVMGGLQILMGKWRIPRMLVRIMNHLLASIYISNPPITDRPYHLMGGAIYAGPDTLTYNMLLLLTLLTFCMLLMMLNDIIANAMAEEKFLCPKPYIMFGTKRFLSRYADLLFGSAAALAFGYGLLMMRHYYTSEEIVASMLELWEITYRNAFFLPGILLAYLFLMAAGFILAHIFRTLHKGFTEFFNRWEQSL